MKQNILETLCTVSAYLVKQQNSSSSESKQKLLIAGLMGITACMLVLAYGFGAATYTLSSTTVATLPATLNTAELNALVDVTFASDIQFREAVTNIIGAAEYRQHESALINGSVSLNPLLILFGILGFVASFAVSLGPVMWVLFSELFPNYLRALAVSLAGFVNSAVSFGVQLLFPWELATFGNSLTFLLYGVFAALGLIFVVRVVPETKGHSLEELEKILVSK